jgi:hypothetical protein
MEEVMRKRNVSSPPIRLVGEQHSSRTPLPDEQRRELYALVLRDGEHEAAKALGSNRLSVLKALAGLPLTAAVCCLLETRLRERSAP